MANTLSLHAGDILKFSLDSIKKLIQIQKVDQE